MLLTPPQLVKEIEAAVETIQVIYNDQFTHQFGDGQFTIPYRCNGLVMVFSGIMLPRKASKSQKQNATIHCVLEGSSFGTLQAVADLLNQKGGFSNIAVNVHKLGFVVRAFA